MLFEQAESQQLINQMQEDLAVQQQVDLEGNMEEQMPPEQQ
jgi:hypothetical protein